MDQRCFIFILLNPNDFSNQHTQEPKPHVWDLAGQELKAHNEAGPKSHIVCYR